MNRDKAHIDTGIRRILEVPFIYNIFQTLHGGNKQREKYFNENFSDPQIKKMLDVGCGTGILLNHLAKDVEYHGIDIEESYIKHAKEKYGDRGFFYKERVGEVIKEEWNNYFDAINAYGLIHHLNEADSLSFLEKSHKYLKKGGFLLTLDPVYYHGQSGISRWMVSKDRGQNIRTQEQYLTLAKKYFQTIKTELVKKHNRIYYSVFIMKMYK